MLRRGIAFVAGQPVLRIQRVELAQQVVAMHLGQYAGRRNGGRERVAMDDGLLRAIEVHGRGVHQQEIRGGLELLDGQLHGQSAGLQNIDAVNS